MTLILSGDNNNAPMPMTDAQVNHLRRLLAWMRTEYTLDEDMQRGYLMGLSESMRHGLADSEKANSMLQQKAEEINRVPAYIRQAVKMLTKAVRDHDKNTGVIEP